LVIVSDGHLSSNAVAAGVAPDGEFEVGRATDRKDGQWIGEGEQPGHFTLFLTLPGAPATLPRDRNTLIDESP